MVKSILLTRPAPQTSAYLTELSARLGSKVSCISSPLLEIQPVENAPDFSGVQAVLFTSANGVRTLANMVSKKPIIPCLCVGDKTAIEARNLGCDAFSAKGGADELVQLATMVLSQDAGPILYIHGEIVAGDIVEKLSREGFAVIDHVIYRQVPLALSDEAKNLLMTGKIDILPVFSPMTASLLAAEMRANPDWVLDEIDAICLSKNVRTQVEGLNFRSVTTVNTPTADAMSAAIVELLRR